MKHKSKLLLVAIIASISIILGLFIWNLVSANKSGSQANIYTAISGWVSGVATIVLGAIAITQNFIFKNASEKTAIEYDLSNRLNQLNDVMEKVDSIVNADEFLAIGLEYVHNLDNWKGTKIYEKVKANIRYKYMYYGKANSLAHLCRKINIDNLHFKHKNSLCVLLDESMKMLFDVGDFYNNNDIKTSDEIMLKISTISEKLSALCKKLSDVFLDYIFEYDDFISDLKTKNLAIIKKAISHKRILEQERRYAFKSKLTE